MIDQNAERKEYERQIDVLLATDTGLDRWCWMRRRASKLIECEWGDDGLVNGGLMDCLLLVVRVLGVVDVG